MRTPTPLGSSDIPWPKCDCLNTLIVAPSVGVDGRDQHRAERSANEMGNRVNWAEATFPLAFTLSSSPWCLARLSARLSTAPAPQTNLSYQVKVSAAEIPSKHYADDANNQKSWCRSPGIGTGSGKGPTVYGAGLENFS